MEQHIRNDPAGDAGPSELFCAELSGNTATLNLAQAMQRRRLQRDHGLSVPLATLIASLCFGEGTV